MPTAERTSLEPERITPISCEKCGGKSSLIHLSPDALSLGQSEHWTFECAECGHMVTRTINN
jgi:hypothetical protein